MESRRFRQQHDWSATERIQVSQSACYRWFLLIVMLQLDAELQGICLLLTQDGTNWTFQCDLTNLQTQISYLMSAEFRLDLSCTGHNSSLISSQNPFKPSSDCFISTMLMDIIANKPGNYRCLKFYKMLTRSPRWPIKLKWVQKSRVLSSLRLLRKGLISLGNMSAEPGKKQSLTHVAFWWTEKSNSWGSVTPQCQITNALPQV